MSVQQKLLLVEDEASTRLHYHVLLSKNVEFEVTVCATFEEAQYLIDKKNYDIVITDIQLIPIGEKIKRKRFYGGLALGDQIRVKSADTVIIMYSSFLDEPGGVSREEARSHGADLVYSRTALSKLTIRTLMEDINRIISSSRTKEDVQRSMSFQKNLRTDVLRDMIGDRELAQLLRKAIPNSKSDTVSALQAGNSGAQIAMVESQLITGERATNILKISQDRSALMEELDRRPFEGTTVFRNAISPSLRDISSNKWSAILIPFAEGLIELRAYLLDSTTDYLKTLPTMVERLLSHPTADMVDPSDLTNYPDVVQIKKQALLSIIDTIAYLKKLSPHISKATSESISHCEAFLETLRSQNWHFSLKKWPACLLHGDFHSRNVFVSDRQDPRVIDFGRRDIYPRMIDYCCLHVDVLINVVSSSPIDNTCLDRVELWFEGAHKIGIYPNNSMGDVELGTPGINLLMSTLNNSVRAISPNVSQLEYAETFIFHLLRYLKFSDVPIPKKILICKVLDWILGEFKISRL